MIDLDSFILTEYTRILSHLKVVVKVCCAEIKRDPLLYVDDNHDIPSIDVRLCIDSTKHGSFEWIIRTGTVDYDEWHSDFCSGSFIGLETMPAILLERLIKGLNNGNDKD